MRRRAVPPISVALARALGVASLALGLAGLVAPERLGSFLRVDRSTVWMIAVRDLAVAWLLLGRGEATALYTRALFDMGDAVMMIRRRPTSAAVAAGASLVALAAGVAARE